MNRLDDVIPHFPQFQVSDQQGAASALSEAILRCISQEGIQPNVSERCCLASADEGYGPKRISVTGVDREKLTGSKFYLTVWPKAPFFR